jgi:hypothetical protein
VQRPQDDLDLVVLAGIVAVQRAIDQEARPHDVDLAGDHQRLQRGGLVVEAHEVELLGRRLRGEDQVLHGTAGDADAQPAEIVDRLDRAAGRRHQHRRLGGVRNREPDLLSTLGRDAEERDDHVDAVGQQERQPVGPGHGHELDLDAQILGREARDVGIVTLGLAVGAGETEDRRGRVDADDDLAALDDLVDRLGRERGGDQEQEDREREECCRPPAVCTHGEASVRRVGESTGCRDRHTVGDSRNRVNVRDRLPP